MNRGCEYAIDRGRRILIQAEWVERRRRVRVEQGGAQACRVRDSAEPLDAVVFAIPERTLPIPFRKIGSELAEVSFEAGGKDIIAGLDFVRPHTCFQTAIANAGDELGAGRRRALSIGGNIWIESSG